MYDSVAVCVCIQFILMLFRKLQLHKTYIFILFLSFFCISLHPLVENRGHEHIESAEILGTEIKTCDLLNMWALEMVVQVK